MVADIPHYIVRTLRFRLRLIVPLQVPERFRNRRADKGSCFSVAIDGGFLESPVQAFGMTGNLGGVQLLLLLVQAPIEA